MDSSAFDITDKRQCAIKSPCIISTIKHRFIENKSSPLLSVKGASFHFGIKNTSVSISTSVTSISTSVSTNIVNICRK